MKEHVAGIVLTGGLSRRMGGGDKSLLELGGRPVLKHVLENLGRQVETMAINANGDPERFARFGLPVFADTVAGFAGPLAGVLAAMEWATSNTPCRTVLTAAGDTPFFPHDLAERLTAAAKERPSLIAVAVCDGRRHPTFALWPTALRDALHRFLVDEGNRKVSAFIDRNDFIDVDFPKAVFGQDVVDPFFNINTPQDLAEAERLLSRRSP